MSEIRTIAPEICSTVIHKDDQTKWRAWQLTGGTCPFMLHSYRVNGYYRPKTPPTPGKNWIADILWESYDWHDKLKPCRREDATHISASGVCGLLALIEDVVVVGRVNWTLEQCEEHRESWYHRVDSGKEEL